MRVVNDRRGSIRVTVRGEAFLHTPQGSLRCRCLDLSPTGMSMVSAQAIKARQWVRVESSFKGQRLVLDARVVRRTRTRDGHVLGMRFEGLSGAAKEQLEVVLRSMQVQATLAQQSCGLVDGLPTLQLPEPEPAPPTERSPHAEPAPWSAPTVVMPPVASARRPRWGASMVAPSPAAVGDVQAIPRWDATMVAPSPAAVSDAQASPRWDATMVAPSPAAVSDAQASPRWDATMVAPSPAPAAVALPAYPSLGLDDGWTEEELVTTHYRPAEGTEPPAEPPRHTPSPASAPAGRDVDVDGIVPELPDALDCTEVAGPVDVTEAPLHDWEPGAPVALAELVDTDAGLRARSGETVVIHVQDLSAAPEADEAAVEWCVPVRTGETLAIHLEEPSVAPLAIPIADDALDLDLPEPTAPVATPAVPRLSDELQAALDRLRRREDGDPDEPPPRRAPSVHRPQRPLGATDVRATARREDTQIRALYHAALVDLGEPDRGDGS
jgi:hypothetical protein